MAYTLPDSATITLIKPDFDALVTGLESAQTDRDFYINEASLALDELERLRPQLVDLNGRIGDLTAEVGSLKTQAVLRDNMVITLNAEIARLKGTLPPTPARLTRTSSPRLYGVTIEKSKTSPSKALYDTVKTAMQWAKRLGFDTWRGFFNPQEVRDHLKATPPLGNLVAYGKAQGLRFLADTLDTILKQLPSDVDLKAYMDGLIALGCEGVYINDADQYTLEVLRGYVARLRTAAPEMPIFVSLRASANVSLYKEMVDYVEIQTFGTTAELARFLALDDALAFKLVMCLDARAPMTVTDFAQRAAVILKNAPEAFFYYADQPGDYEAQPDEEDVILKGLLALLKTRG